jgi:protoheme IX farnesyltransferase
MSVPLAAPSVPGAVPAARARRGVAAYLALTKPRIIELLLVTTVPPMMLARHGVPPPGLLAATLAGGALTAGGANALNCWLDRDIDARMRRTARRPLVRAADPVPPVRALAFGVLLGVAGTALLAAATTPLAAALAAGALLFYVLVYTLLLKRRTASNIVIGGAAGAAPVLVGWAAVTGRVAWPAVLLALLVFVWTPPHFWALALRFRADYAAAGVPMLPVVAAPAVVGRRIVGYTVATVAVSLGLVPWAGVGYGLVAAGVGAWFLRAAVRLAADLRAGRDGRPLVLFRASITYLTVLFAAVAVAAVLT